MSWKDSRKKPEEFSKEAQALLKQEKERRELATFRDELKQASTKLSEISGQLRRLLALTDESVRSIRYETLQKVSVKEKESGLKESELKQTEVNESQVREYDKEIENLLSVRSMTFTELLNELGISTATLTRYLDELVGQGKIERTEVGRNVVYRLKPLQTGQEFHESG